jgi:hypothetical protein
MQELEHEPPIRTTSSSGGGRITSFSIRLPHNSLLVCWEGFQEFWRHEAEMPRDVSEDGWYELTKKCLHKG